MGFDRLDFVFEAIHKKVGELAMIWALNLVLMVSFLLLLPLIKWCPYGVFMSVLPI